VLTGALTVLLALLAAPVIEAQMVGVSGGSSGLADWTLADTSRTTGGLLRSRSRTPKLAGMATPARCRSRLCFGNRRHA
jgi:hypothetical protein